jgi:hypothetical protein
MARTVTRVKERPGFQKSSAKKGAKKFAVKKAKPKEVTLATDFSEK